MIRGQQVFVEHFKGFEDCYIVIGGLAVNTHLNAQGVRFRATKDFDLILVMEALTPEFFDHFWTFILEGGYGAKEVAETKRQFYRFTNPVKENYPAQIELFSKKPDVIPVIEGHRIVPIPTESVVTSLSAIMMDDDYYNLIKDNVVQVDGLSIAREPLLICLKIKAFLDLSKRKSDGEKIDSRNIKKHKNDVFRIGVTLTGQEKMQVSSSILKDMKLYFDIIRNEQSNIRDILKNMGIDVNIQPQDILEILESIFYTD